MTFEPKPFELNELDDPVPAGIGTDITPRMYRLFVMPVKPRDKVGSIIMADVSKEYEEYFTQVGRVVAIGPGCFKVDRIQKLDPELSSLVRVGSFIFYTARNPMKFVFQGAKVVIINDDEIAGVLSGSDVVQNVRTNV